MLLDKYCDLCEMFSLRSKGLALGTRAVQLFIRDSLSVASRNRLVKISAGTGITRLTSLGQRYVSLIYPVLRKSICYTSSSCEMSNISYLKHSGDLECTAGTMNEGISTA